MNVIIKAILSVVIFTVGAVASKWVQETTGSTQYWVHAVVGLTLLFIWKKKNKS